MTEAAATFQPGVRSPTSRLADAVRLRPPEWLWAVTLGAQVLVTALLTSYTYFFTDDFLLLRQAQTSVFGWTYLKLPLFEHFSPVTRILNKVLVDVAPGSFGFARALELVMFAAAIAAMMFVLRTIMGRTWGALALTVLFGQSIFLLRLLTWWTATANILPATVGMLLALGAYLRWWLGGGRGWLLFGFAAFALSLIDYETAMLFPVNLLLIRLLVLSDRLDPGEWVKIVWRERVIWIVFAALDIAALANYFSGGYYSRMQHPTPGQVFHFLDIAFFQTFIPGLFGIKQLPSSGTATAVATALAFSAIAAVTLYFRPRAWRCLVAMLAAFLVTLLPLGLNRIGLFGVGVGAEPYYHQSAQFMFVVLAGFALTRRWGGERTDARTPAWTGWRAPLLAALVLIAGGAYTAFYLTSAHLLKQEALLPRATRAFLARVRADVHRLGTPSRPPNLIDVTVGGGLMPATYIPFNQYAEFFPVADIRFRYNDPDQPAYVVSASGALHRVTFVPLASGRLGATVASGAGQPTGVRAQRRGGAACLPAGPPNVLRIPMSRAQSVSPRVGQLPYALLIRYTLPTRAVVSVGLAGGGTEVPATFGVTVWGPGRGATYTLIGTTARFDHVSLGLPGGACVSETTLGTFRSGLA